MTFPLGYRMNEELFHFVIVKFHYYEKSKRNKKECCTFFARCNSLFIWIRKDDNKQQARRPVSK